MIHPLCQKCLCKCKQDKTVKIVKCPKFQKRLSDSEFDNLVDSLKEMENDAVVLKKRSKELINKAHLKNEDFINGSVTNIGETGEKESNV